MVAPIDSVFKALSDPTRRRVVERLGRSPASVSELHEPFDMALPSFVQHLRVLVDVNTNIQCTVTPVFAKRACDVRPIPG